MFEFRVSRHLARPNENLVEFWVNGKLRATIYGHEIGLNVIGRNIEAKKHRSDGEIDEWLVILEEGQAIFSEVGDEGSNRERAEGGR